MKEKMQSNGMQPSVAPKPSGMNCPVCNAFIPISIYELLYNGAIACPSCGVSFTINRALSKPAMIALEKVVNATQKAEAMQQINL